MDIQPITDRGRTVAACTHERIFLAEALERRSPGDPELTFVLYMCAYSSECASPLATPDNFSISGVGFVTA